MDISGIPGYLDMEDDVLDALRTRISEYNALGYRSGGIDYSTDKRFETTTYIVGPDGSKIPNTTTYDEYYNYASWLLFFELVDSSEAS